MKPLSDAAVERLRDVVDRPDPGDRYEIHEVLGRGGMGAVYRATDRVLQRDVALKVLTIELEAGDVARKLEQEARVLAALEHQGIVAIHDAGTLVDGRPFYVMRLVRGRRLDEQALRESRGERLRRFLAVCDAVSFAHSRGVIHRDLKPANIMVGEFGEVLVLDWGVAKVAALSDTSSSSGRQVTNNDTGDGVAVGTPGFMAPEQSTGVGPIDERADVFALGAILRELTTTEKVPPPLRAIIAHATATDPAQRYVSVDALADDVRAWLDGAAVSAYKEPPWERIARFYRRNSALVLLLFAYLVVRLVILWWRGV
jgi:eukaryotic-like serine/threonine-protein kinase